MRMSTRQADSGSAPVPDRHSDDLVRIIPFQTLRGQGLVGADEVGLRFVELPPLVSRERAGLADVGEPIDDGGATPSGRALRNARRWAGQLEEYFRGERASWSSDEIPWEALGLGSFERAVHEALLTVKPGETVSYGRLAERAGYPRAARAVGTAMARNPIPIVIPCHRVVRSDGSLGNYGNDPSWKPQLLEHERAMSSREGRG